MIFLAFRFRYAKKTWYQNIVLLLYFVLVSELFEISVYKSWRVWWLYLNG